MDMKKLAFVAMAAFAFMMFLGGKHLATTSKFGPRETDGFVNYIIPKLKTFVPRFSLWDRTFVDRRKLAPKGPDKDKKKNSMLAQGTPLPTASPVPKNQANASPTPAPTSKPRFVVDGATSTSNPDGFDPTAEAPHDDLVAVPRSRPPDEVSPETEIGEWKMKILRNPSKETMNEFVFAYQTGKVKKMVFYQVIDELLNDSGSDIQKLAIYGLAAIPSYESFSALMTHKYHLASDTQGMMKATLDGYARPERLNLLKVALSSRNPPIVIGAMPLVVETSKKMNLWSTDQSSHSDDRRRRGPTTRIPKNDFIEIFKILRDLADSSDRQISQAANDSLAQMTYDSPIASGRE